MIKALLTGCLVSFTSLFAKSEVVLPKILGHRMVLQQGRGVPIWGTAKPGESVTVRFAEQEQKTFAGENGNWKIVLSPMPASAKPRDLVILASNTITLHDILVGEVWFCSGQSNMEYTMRKNSKVVPKPDIKGSNPVDELDVAHNPAIRIFLVNRKEVVKPDPKHEGWNVAEDSALRSFSAAGYFFAKELNRVLGVPVGMISSAVPGIDIEPWLSGTLSFATSADGIPDPLPYDEAKPGKFYPNMVQPVAPFAVKGFLWYQGETNCFQNERLEYAYKMEQLVSDWRKLWQDRDLPFYYVQLAPYYYSKSAGKYPLTDQTLPWFWEAQRIAQHTRGTAMATITDLVKSPDDLHPGFKWEVGRRLALLALQHTYKRSVQSSGPVMEKLSVTGRKATLQFRETGKGLIANDGQALRAFELCGADGRFFPADAKIDGKTVILSSPDVSKPVDARFGWSETGMFNFFNKDGLPAVPFGTCKPIDRAYWERREVK